jgi:hypothetical protein
MTARGPPAYLGTGPPHPVPGCQRHREARSGHARILIETCSSGHYYRMPAPLFARKPGYCPYGHSLAPGMPQKISWLPCMCEPAREAGSQGRGLGHMTLWCGTCSAEDRRDSRFFEPAAAVPSAAGRHGRPSSASATTAKATATAPGWSAAGTVTMLMSCRAVCAHMMLVFRREAACLAAAANPASPARDEPS